MLEKIKSFLSHPLTRGIEIDAPETSILRHRIIQDKAFLRQIYLKWYSSIIDDLPEHIRGPVLELGSGAGFLKELLPGLITSDILHIPSVDIVIDGQCLPIKKGSLRGIVMNNVFHHLPRARAFLSEASCCLKPGGVMIMIESWNTWWSQKIYKHLHHEPFDFDSKAWEFSKRGPLSQANSALPWIVFHRDREIFECEFPDLHVKQIQLHMPFCFVLSGGVSFRSFLPGALFGLCQRLEDMFEPWMHFCAMFATISIEKNA